MEIYLNYFTSKIEIKPQPAIYGTTANKNYFTSKIEIKPQLFISLIVISFNYFTSKIEIKPQLFCLAISLSVIILHQRSKSNHNFGR